MSEGVTLTVVMPCLNEEANVATCVKKALAAFAKAGLAGEVVVVDNGSKDRSAELAAAAGARVIRHDVKGYGAALRRGFAEARGEFILMGDADNTYDYTEIPLFMAGLRAGADLVMGTRLGGTIHPGAMPWLHRYVGTPVLTAVLNLFFRARITDTNCGMRGFRKAAIDGLGLKCNGMEFASEMVVKAARARLKLSEVPINYYASTAGRVVHLRSFHDGWRHLRFMLVLAPKWLFLYPGTLLFLAGLLLTALLQFKEAHIFGVPLGLSTAVFAGAMLILGMQIAQFGIYAMILDSTRGIVPDDRVTRLVMRHFTLEKGLITATLILLAGLVLGGVTAVLLWQVSAAGGGISVTATKLATLSISIVILGIQIMFASFYVSLLELEKTLG